MNYLLTLTDKDVFKEPEFAVPDAYIKRPTVKAVVVNDKGEYGFVTNPIHGFYLLAGGGAESDDLSQEIIRECDEELNVAVLVLREIGAVHEYRNRKHKELDTTCFLAKVTGELAEDTRTEEEKDKNLQSVWLSEEEAIRVLKEQEEEVKRRAIGFYNTTFSIVRDAAFFAEYLKTR